MTELKMEMHRLWSYVYLLNYYSELKQIADFQVVLHAVSSGIVDAYPKLDGALDRSYKLFHTEVLSGLNHGSTNRVIQPRRSDGYKDQNEKRHR